MVDRRLPLLLRRTIGLRMESTKKDGPLARAVRFTVVRGIS